MIQALKHQILILAAFNGIQLAAAAEIKVQLFGQPCVLQGPLDEEALQKVHAVSPEQLFPDATLPELTSAQLKAALAKIQAAGALPPALDTYRDRLSQRIDAQLAFNQALEESRKGQNAAGSLARLRKHYRSGTWKAFEALFRKKGAPKGEPKADRDEKLKEMLAQALEPDPEEDFHRGIQRLNVRYTCAFETPPNP